MADAAREVIGAVRDEGAYAGEPCDGGVIWSGARLVGLAWPLGGYGNYGCPWGRALRGGPAMSRLNMAVCRLHIRWRLPVVPAFTLPAVLGSLPATCLAISIILLARSAWLLSGVTVNRVRYTF